jgi:DNA-binding MarR family transcriptional regulator
MHDPSALPARAPSRVRDRASWLVGRAYARSSALLNEAFETHGGGLRGYHYRLLAALDEWGPVSQIELGRATGIDRSDVTQALDDLGAQGLVERAVDPADRRRNVVSITRSGRRRLAALDGVVDGVQEQLLAPLSAAQRKQFATLLHRVIDGA